MLSCLEDHARLKLLEGDAQTAVRISATVTVARTRLDLARTPAAETRWQGHLETLRELVPNDAFVAAWAEAWDHWEVDDAIRQALIAPAKQHKTSAP